MKKYMRWILVLAFIIFVCWAAKMDCNNPAYGSSVKPSTQITIASHTIYLDGNSVGVGKQSNVLPQ